MARLNFKILPKFFCHGILGRTEDAVIVSESVNKIDGRLHIATYI